MAKTKTVQKKKNIFHRISKSIKEIISELKKVTWAKGKDVVKNTGVVLVVVLFFLITIGLTDSLLSYLFKLLVGA